MTMYTQDFFHIIISHLIIIPIGSTDSNNHTVHDVTVVEHVHTPTSAYHLVLIQSSKFIAIYRQGNAHGNDVSIGFFYNISHTLFIIILIGSADNSNHTVHDVTAVEHAHTPTSPNHLVLIQSSKFIAILQYTFNCNTNENDV